MSASDGAGGSRVTDLFDRAASADSLSGIIFQGVGGVVLAGGTAITSGVLTLADLLIIPLSTLGVNAGDLLDAIFGGSAQIINIGALTTAASLGPGGTFNVGPLTFALALGSVLAGLYVLRAYLSEEDTGNLIPGLPDIPTPGFGGPEEDE